MIPLVVDASMALAWCFPEESSPRTERVLDQVVRSGALVPALWHFEVANTVTQAVKSGRISAADRSRILDDLSGLDIRTDVHVPIAERLCWAAESFGLTAYDASYVLLAMDRSVPIASLDRAVIRAARKAGLTLA